MSRGFSVRRTARSRVAARAQRAGEPIRGAAGARPRSVPRRVALAWALLSLSFGASCKAGQTKPIDEVREAGSTVERARARALAERLASSVIRRGADVAVGATEGGLSGVPLGGGSTWRYPHAIDSVPFLAGDIVVAEGDGQLFALAASDGRPLWERPTGGRALRGAGDDGATTVVCLEPLADAGSVLLAIDRNGRVLRQLETEDEIGRPAVVGNVALLPFRGRWISGYDIALGVEIGRLSLLERATHVVVTAGAPYAAETSLLRLDESLLSPLSSRLLPPTPVFAPAVRWLSSALEPHPVSGAVRDRTLAFAELRPAEQGPGFVDDRVYLATRRMVFSMHAPPGQAAEVSWFHTHPTTVLAGAAYGGGIALCDSEGMVTFIDSATGEKGGRLSLEGRITTCVMQADGLSRVSGGTSPPPLDQQVGDLFARDEEALLGGKRDVLQYLSTRALDEETTRVLVDLAAGNTARGVEPELEAALAQRRSGSSYLLAGLGKLLSKPRPFEGWTPVAALAEALSALVDRRATPLLLRALLDPDLRRADAPRVAAAAAILAGETDVSALEAFLDRKLPGNPDDDEARAVVHVARALLRVGGARGLARVTRAANDPLTPPGLRAPLLALIAAEPAGK